MQRGWGRSSFAVGTWTDRDLKSSAFYRKSGVVTLGDHFGGVLRTAELSSIMDYLNGILGLSISLFSYKKGMFRFDISTGSKYFKADHKVADEACARAVERWMDAGRPLPGDLPTKHK
jgi:hypothetical protein